MTAIGLIVGLAVGFLLVAAIIYYFQFGRQNEELPMHHTQQPVYVQQVQGQQVPVQHDISTAVYAAPPPQPAYAANQVIYAQAPPPQGSHGGYQGQGGQGGGVSGASVAMGAAAGMAGGLLVGGLIASADHSGSGHGGDDGGFAGDF